MKDPAITPQRQSKATWLWPASAFLAIFALAFTYVLHHFYHLGGMRDSLWFSGLMDHNGWTLPDPPSVAFVPGISFFYTHLSPVFYLPNALGFLSPFPPSVWYALWYGLLHALMVPAFYALARSVLPLRAPLCALLALLFALNGNAVMALQMPHFELLIPALIAWLLALIVQQKRAGSVALVLLILTVREDAGFHVAALLLSGAAVRALWTRQLAHTPMDRDAWRIGLMALAGAVLCVVIQKAGWGDNGMLGRNYIGSPPFSHMTPALLQARWDNVLHERTYLWLPFAISCAWAVAARNVLLPVGFLAYLPWLALQFFAAADVMGTLSWYYAFPAIASLAWPLFAMGWQHGRLTPLQGRRTALWMGALLLSTTAGQLNGRIMCYPWELIRGMSSPVTAMQAGERFMDAVAAQPAAFGRLSMDTAVMALRPRLFQPGQRAEYLPRTGDDIDTLMWFDPGAFDSGAWALARARHLDHRFMVPGTPIVMASRRDLLQEQPRLQSLMVRANLFARRTQAVHATAGADGGWVVNADSPGDIAITAPMTVRHEGLFQVPGVALAPGRYTLTATIHLKQVVNEDQPLFTIWQQHPWAPGRNASASFHQAQLQPLGGDRYGLRWDLSVPDSAANDPWPRMVQLEWHQTGNATYTIVQWALLETSYP